MNAVVFSTSNTFDDGEIVLAPRTRGGFSYAKVTKQLVRNQCYFDSQAEHETKTWRVVYLNNGKSLFKDLPAPYIGKLPSGPHISEKDVRQTMEEEAEDLESTRNIGEKPDMKDLQCVVFSPQCNFKPDEIVLVARSGGGFTYGRVYKETKQHCKLAIKDPHSLPSWKVLVGSESSKELCAACIGKIELVTGSVEIPKKSRRAIFAECEEFPDPSNAAKKESEVIDAPEKDGKMTTVARARES